MTDNHNHALEEVLAGTVPQARPEFEQALEDQLMHAVQERIQSTEMKSMNIHNSKDKPKRVPRGLPVTLAATFAMILFGGLAAFITSRPLVEAPFFSGAAQNQQEAVQPDMFATATAIILQATYQAAEAQLLTANAQLQALEQAATAQAAAANPDSAMTSVVQTATAVVDQATAHASGHLLEQAALTATAMIHWATQEAAAVFAATADSAGGQTLLMPSLVPTSTPIGGIPAGTMPQTCLPENLVIYSAPGAQNPVVASINPLGADKFQVQGLLTLHETGEDWFFVSFTHEGAEAQGWVQANTISGGCQPFASPALAEGTLLPPTIVPPVLGPMFTATPVPFSGAAVSLLCPAQQLLLYAEPSRSAALVADLPFDSTLYIEGALMLNMGDSWLLVSLQGVRGWLPKTALPPECIQVLAPAGVPLLDKISSDGLTSVPTVPPAFTPTAWDAPYMLLTPPFTATPLIIAPEVEQMDDSTYQITLSIAEEPVTEIEAGDDVSVLAEMTFGIDGRAWIVVAQDVQVAALLEPSMDAGSFRWMDVVLASSDEETMALLRDMAAAGVAFALERTP